MKILLVEDDKKVASFIKRGLTESNIEVDWLPSGLQVNKMLSTNDYQLVILDILLPQSNGIEICRQIRSFDKKTPILMLTALGTIDDKVNGLEAGADDYLVKPFELRELMARLNALTRRNQPEEKNQKLELANLSMDLYSKIVTRNKEDIQLTAREFNLLKFLLQNQGRVISRSEIENRIWGNNLDIESNVVDVYINFLRKKIDKNFEPKLIHTLIGMGYVVKVKSK